MFVTCKSHVCIARIKNYLSRGNKNKNLLAARPRTSTPDVRQFSAGANVAHNNVLLCLVRLSSMFCTSPRQSRRKDNKTHDTNERLVCFLVRNHKTKTFCKHYRGEDIGGSILGVGFKIGTGTHFVGWNRYRYF